MKGLRLHVRPATSDDLPGVTKLLGEDLPDPSLPATDFVAKLIGDLVAWARTKEQQDSLVLLQMFVIPSLRHKRIGTVLLSEISAWASSNGLKRIIIEEGVLPPDFLTRSGFAAHENSFIKVLSQ